MDHLKQLWKDTVIAQHRATRAGAAAREAAAKFDAAIAEAREQLCVSPGHDIDVLGDGRVKPEAECKRTLS